MTLRRRLAHIRDWGRRRPALVAAGVYACLALVFVGPGLVPGRTLSGSELLWTYVPWRASAPGDISPTQNFNLNDAVFVFQPFFAFTNSVLPDVPLWNPNLMSGRPFLANAQSAVFSPFSLPAYVLPFWSSLAVIAALKIFVAAFGTYLLGRALHMRMGGALLAGLTYGFSLWIVSWLSWPQSSVWALIPWLVLVTERLIRRPGPLEVAGLAGVVAIQFLGGHPESSRDALLAPLVFFACRLASTSGLDLRQVVRRCAGFAAALVLGAGLSALTIVPFLDLVRDSADITERTAVGGEGTSARFLLGLFVPNYWGRPGTTSADPFITFFTDRAFYVGALGLMLAAAAVVSHPARERIAVACFGGAALAVSLGLPPFDVLFSALPGQDALRADRLTPLFLITLAVLAGWGLDDLSARDAAPRRGRLVAVCCGALACAPVVWMAVIGTLSLDHLRTALDLAWGFATPAPGFFENSARPQVVRLGALLEWIVLAAAAVALVTLRLRRSIPASLFVLLALGLAVVDLFKAGMGFNPAVPVDRAEQPATGAIRYLQARRPERFTALDGGLSTRTMPVDVAMRYGLADARGRDFPIDARYKAFWARNIALSAAAPASRLIVRRLTPRALHALSLLSVTNILLDPREPVPATGGLRTAYTGPDARIVKNERALPHTFLVERQQVVAGADEALAAVSDTTFDAHRFAITERPLPGLARAPARSGSRGRARIETYEAERVVVGATAPRPSLLVLTDSYARGWKVTVDGVSAPLHRVDYLLRGVMVPAGAHRVEFRYQPASWRIGWIISAVSVLILAALISAGVVARRRLRP